MIGGKNARGQLVFRSFGIVLEAGKGKPGQNGEKVGRQQSGWPAVPEPEIADAENGAFGFQRVVVDPDIAFRGAFESVGAPFLAREFPVRPSQRQNGVLGALDEMHGPVRDVDLQAEVVIPEEVHDLRGKPHGRNGRGKRFVQHHGRGEEAVLNNERPRVDAELVAGVPVALLDPGDAHFAQKIGAEGAKENDQRYEEIFHHCFAPEKSKQLTIIYLF